MSSTENPGRFVGLLYVLVSIPGAFALVYVPSKLIVEDAIACRVASRITSGWPTILEPARLLRASRICVEVDPGNTTTLRFRARHPVKVRPEDGARDVVASVP